MTKLCRFPDPRSTFFITNVTCDRRFVLVDHFDFLWQAIATAQSRLNVDLQAWVILPDHFHMVVDTGGSDISGFLQRLKMSFSVLYNKSIGTRSGRVWQNGFWDHIIRDQEDWNHHVDYIHYNPVKHGYVLSPFDWRHSTIHDFYQKGIYTPDWGRKTVSCEGDFGE